MHNQDQNFYMVIETNKVKNRMLFNKMTHCTMSKHSYHGATSCSLHSRVSAYHANMKLLIS